MTNVITTKSRAREGKGSTKGNENKNKVAQETEDGTENRNGRRKRKKMIDKKDERRIVKTKIRRADIDWQ